MDLLVIILLFAGVSLVLLVPALAGMHRSS